MNKSLASNHISLHFTIYRAKRLGCAGLDLFLFSALPKYE